MWMRVDDRLHAHRKTRTVLRSHPDKIRDSAPMGIWVLAGSWSAQNGTDGWVPVDELERFDDDWESLTKRLIAADYWWPEQRGGEEGYGFVDWSEWNTSKERQSADGKFGNHERWHVRRGIIKPGCDLCPMDPESGSESPPDIAPRSGGDRVGDSETIAFPTQSLPDPIPEKPFAHPRSETDRRDQGDDQLADRFDEFWNAYDKKRGRKKAEQKYALALKKADVTEGCLITAASAYIEGQRAAGKHPEFTKDPATWLSGEHWNDEAMENRPVPNRPPHAHDLEKPPSGLTADQYAKWDWERRQKRGSA